MGIFTFEDGTSDPVLTRIVDEDKVPWYKKPNLRVLYLLLFPACMGIEMTSGFDSQLINALQFITPFNKCQYTSEAFQHRLNYYQTLEMATKTR